MRSLCTLASNETSSWNDATLYGSTFIRMFRWPDVVVVVVVLLVEAVPALLQAQKDQIPGAEMALKAVRAPAPKRRR